ncbi:MAG: hypothetical protein L3J03_03905 [Desulfobacterales bacterium]|nr:hypothetical protein [Desulfobacterales bacterium]
MKELLQIVEKMDPKEAMTALAGAVSTLFKHIDENAKLDFVVSLIGDSGNDKISSMVNL